MCFQKFVENSRKALDALDERQIDEKKARKMRPNSVHPTTAVRQPSAIAVIRPSTAAVRIQDDVRIHL